MLNLKDLIIYLLFILFIYLLICKFFIYSPKLKEPNSNYSGNGIVNLLKNKGVFRGNELDIGSDYKGPENNIYLKITRDTSASEKVIEDLRNQVIDLKSRAKICERNVRTINSIYGI